MKLTYLGTAAAEGMPAVFCRCEYCNEARRLGGKNVRTRSQALVNDDLLIDLPADTYHHFLTNGIEGDRIPHLLITHTHSDHLYPAELEMRTLGYAHDTGYFYDEVFDYLAGRGIHLDMVSYDCTNGDLPIPDEGTHMGFPNIARVQARLRTLGVIDEHTVQYVNHFSHNAGPLHEAFEKRAADIGCGCSFDGCTVEF